MFEIAIPAEGIAFLQLGDAPMPFLLRVKFQLSNNNANDG
jgi:hypothetical protein